MNKRLTWLCALTKGDIKENTITMTASTTGNPDRMGDVIFPGAFKATKKSFVDSGSLLVGHDWDDLPIGMILDAAEVGNEFSVTAQFHDTETGQEARQICKERLDAGKQVSVSIGFMPDYDNGVIWFQDGSKLLEFAQNNGYDLNAFDSKAIKQLGYCRGITGMTDLFEVSLVTVGANPKARATNAKQFEPDIEALSALKLVDHLDAALSVVESLAVRLADYKASRDRDGRQISPDRVMQIKRAQDVLAKVLEGVDEPENPSDDPPKTASKFDELAAKTLAHRTTMHKLGEL